MAGCFGNHPIDRWMEGQLNRYLDSQDEIGDFEFDFCHKVKGKGTVKVCCDAVLERSVNDDGYSWSYRCSVKSVHWTFDKEIDVNLNNDEMNEIQWAADTEMELTRKDF